MTKQREMQPAVSLSEEMSTWIGLSYPDSATYSLTRSPTRSSTRSSTRSPTPSFIDSPYPPCLSFPTPFLHIYIEVLEPHFNRQSPHSILMIGARTSGRYIHTTFYERDSLPLQKHVLPVVTRIEISTRTLSIRTLSIPFVDYPRTACHSTAALER